MRPSIDLYLLRDSLNQLSETTYFTAQLHGFAKRLVAAIDHVIADASTYGPDIVREFATHVRGAQRYLSGSTTKEAPYEMEYCLRSALKDWTPRECIITTALTAEQDFHFRPADPWAFIKRAINNFDTAGYNPLLVQLGLPRLYKHKPIFCIPFYHELGHFVDITLGMTKLSLLLDPPNAAVPPQIIIRHRQEFFSDLFAASYVGHSSINTLETIAPSAPASTTHPATADRSQIVNIYLAGNTHPIIDLFQRCLTQLGARPLSKFYDEPTLVEFDDIRPHVINSELRLHGLFEASWRYLLEALDNRAPPWVDADTPPDEIEKIINDLTEKSIRNMSARERWRSGDIV